jgi:DNA-binding PadR family transcriptional regulator
MLPFLILDQGNILSINGIKLTLNDITILGLLLEKKTGVTGLDIEKTIEKRNMRIWTKIGKSSIYFALKKLEKKNYVISATKYYRHNQTTPPVKENYYKITLEGQKELENAIFNILSTHKKIIDPFDIALAFSSYLSLEKRKAAIDTRLKIIKERKELLKSKFEEFSKPGAFGYKIDGTIDNNPGVIQNVLILFSRPISLVEAEENWILNNLKMLI